MREIVLDTETTGLSVQSGHRIIEIGAIELINKSFTGKKFHQYINPERDVPIEAYRIHGISTSYLMDKPKFYQIAEELLNFIANSTLVIHNASFDLAFLNYELSLINQKTLSSENVIDTLALARKQLKSGQRLNLDALGRYFKVGTRGLHGALVDAELLTKVYIKLSHKTQQTYLDFSGTEASQLNMSHLIDSSNSLRTKIIYPSQNELEGHQKLISKIPNSLWN